VSEETTMLASIAASCAVLCSAAESCAQHALLRL